MFPRSIAALLFSLAFARSIPAQSLVSRPVQGHTTPHSIKVWLMVEGADVVTVRLGDSPDQEALLSTQGKPNWQGNVPLTAEFKGLEPHTEYRVRIMLDGKEWGDSTQRYTMRTFAEDQDEYSFMVGSCALYGTGAFRMVRPGTFTHIYDAMRATPSDFFLWLGDNTYLLTGEWNDTARTYEKYTKTRLEDRANAFMRSRPQYAILDDHDFGPDNGDSNFPNKGMTSACFADFWPNPYGGEATNPGNYCHFSFQDSDYFLLDGRYHRQAADSSQMYGPAQMAWLKRELKRSNATFKFIATGSQTLSYVNYGETWADYAERLELFDFIRAERITGVVFLSGDRHFTEMLRDEREGLYPLYEVTCSPLSSVLRRKPLRESDPEHVNPIRVEGTMLVDHNYGRLRVGGPAHDRVCTVEIFGADGQVIWTRAIRANELKW